MVKSRYYNQILQLKVGCGYKSVNFANAFSFYWPSGKTFGTFPPKKGQRPSKKRQKSKSVDRNQKILIEYGIGSIGQRKKRQGCTFTEVAPSGTGLSGKLCHCCDSCLYKTGSCSVVIVHFGKLKRESDQKGTTKTVFVYNCTATRLSSQRVWTFWCVSGSL